MIIENYFFDLRDYYSLYLFHDHQFPNRWFDLIHRPSPTITDYLSDQFPLHSFISLRLLPVPFSLSGQPSPLEKVGISPIANPIFSIRKNMEKRVFLLDDDNDEHEIFLSALRRVDEQVDFNAASDWHEASGMLINFRPDFIFVDLNMPKMDGFSCVMEIRKIQFLRDVPIYIYSTGITEKDGKRALSAGATSYIVKPASFLDLCKTLKKILG